VGFLTFGTVIEINVVSFMFKDIHTAAMKPVATLVALYHEVLRIIGLLTDAIQNIV
jgi:hypothetical protein